MKTKRIISVILAVILALGCVMPSYAASNGNAVGVSKIVRTIDGILENAERFIRSKTENRKNYSDYTEREEYLPLKNHITISLDSPLDYVGAAHRHGNNQHVIISEDFSSVGFEKTKIEKGKWVLTLNVHALITEKADFSVKIEGVTE